MWENLQSKILDKLIQRDNIQEPFNQIIDEYDKCIQRLIDCYQLIPKLETDIELLKKENIEIHALVLNDTEKTEQENELVQTFTESKLRELNKQIENLSVENKNIKDIVLEKNDKLNENQKVIENLQLDIISKDEQILKLESNLKVTLWNLKELEGTNQLLIDEQQALQLAFQTLEHKYTKCKEENNELLERWLKQKSRDIDQINMQNEEFQKKVSKKMSQDLVEAARDMYLNIKGPSNLNNVINNTRIVKPPFSNLHTNAITPQRILFDVAQSHDSEVTSLAPLPSHNDKSFGTGGTDRKIKLWEIGTNSCDLKCEFGGCSGGVTSIQFDSNGIYVIASSTDFATRLWTINDQRLRHTLTGHSGKVMSAKFLDGSCKVVTGSYDRTLKVWDIGSKSCIDTLFAGSSCNDLAVLDKGGNCIVSGHVDKKLRIWDIRTPTERPRLSSFAFSSASTSSTISTMTKSNSPALEISLPSKITSVNCSPDQTLLLTSSRDDVLRLLDTRFNRSNKSSIGGDEDDNSEDNFITSLRGTNFHIAYDWTRASLSPDKKLASCGSGDGFIFIWDLNDSTYIKINPSSNSPNPVLCSGWSNFGSYFISCDNRRKTLIWC